MIKDMNPDCFGASETGKVRNVNEDQFLIAGLNKSMLVHQTSLQFDDCTMINGGTQGNLMLVADGMGGHAEGGEASRIVVNTVIQHVLDTMPWFFRLDTDHWEDLESELKSALERCQSKLASNTAIAPQEKNMGTTLTMAYLLWPRIYIVHAGDSRCYLYRRSRLEQVTTDHTLAQALVENGSIKPEEVDENRLSHVLWNAIGGNEDRVIPDVYKAKLELEDALLLCTDGLSNQVSDGEIKNILETGPSARIACNTLVERANAAGGDDNITAVVAYFREADLSMKSLEKPTGMERKFEDADQNTRDRKNKDADVKAPSDSGDTPAA